MRVIAIMAMSLGLLCPTAAQATVPAEAIQTLITSVCSEYAETASHQEGSTRELCKTEFVKDGRRYEVAYWAERNKRFLDVRRGKPPVEIETVDEWLTFSVIDLSQLDSPDTGRILEQWISFENRSGEIRSGMSGYAFEGGFKPPFIDRYAQGDPFEGILPEGEHLKEHWQQIAEKAVQVTLEHFRSVRYDASLR